MHRVKPNCVITFEIVGMNKVTPAYVIASYRGSNNVMAKLVRWETSATNLALVELGGVNIE